MSERISIVVPNGTIEKLKLKAEENGYTQSALGRKILLDGLKKTAQLLATISSEDLTFRPNINR